MHLKSLCFILCLLLCSCQLFETNNKTGENEELPSLEYDETYDDKAADILKTGGVIVGEKVKVRINPDFKAEVKGNLETGKVVQVTKIGKKRVILEADQKIWCDYEWGYPWLEIDTGDGVTGWVYGKYVYKILDNKLIEETEAPLSTINIPFEFYGQKYFLGMAVDLSYPISTSLGITGCEDIYFPFFFQEDPTQVWPIYYKPKVIKETGQIPLSSLPIDDIWIMIESENIFEFVNDIVDVTRSTIVLQLEQEYTQGLANCNLEIRFNRKEFKATVKDYKVTMY